MKKKTLSPEEGKGKQEWNYFRLKKITSTSKGEEGFQVLFACGGEEKQ